MSPPLISRSPDLKRLRDEGYDLVIRDGYLLVRNVPYVTTSGEVKLGTLVDPLTLAGDVTTRPKSHTVMFSGKMPCDSGGRPLSKVVNSSRHKRLADGLETDHMFSSKPQGGYPDYHAKMTTYSAILANEAQAIDPTATPRTFPVIEAEDAESVFHYVDTATSRAEIGAITDKLTHIRVALVGLGGTGAYILDLVAKTPVGEIHLFDGDSLLQHNAFRAPGAASIDELREVPNKAKYWAHLYSRMHRHVIPHDYFIDESNVEELAEMGFVFVSIEGGPDKELIVKALVKAGVPFIDVGIGLFEVDGSLAGAVRTTTGTEGRHEHIWSRISVSEAAGDNDYDQNIQIADLNALNAALAVIKWKKLRGFYNDLENEHHSTYDIDGNHILNEEQA